MKPGNKCTWASPSRATSNATKMMGFLQRNIKGCSRYTKIAAYKTYVRPVLEYAATVWDPAETAHIHNLEMVQRRGARFTMGLAVNTGDSISISRTLLSLKWPALSIRRRIRRLTMFHGIYQGQNRALQSLTLETEKLKADGRTRRHSKLKHVFRNSNVGKFSFFPKSIRDWNQLPATITEKQGKDSFCREATDFYCQKENKQCRTIFLYIIISLFLPVMLTQYIHPSCTWSDEPQSPFL